MTSPAPSGRNSMDVSGTMGSADLFGMFDGVIHQHWIPGAIFRNGSRKPVMN